MAEQGRFWDPWKMYDATPGELRAIKERAKMREALKAEWTKKVSNPMKAQTSGGFIFDPAVQRFMALKNTQAEYFKGTFRTASIAVLIYALPVALLTWQVLSTKDKKEESIKSGSVMYKDRRDKFFS